MRHDLLNRARRPVQYVNSEVNSVHKEADGNRIIFALAFPDTYELGMSHQGLKILYHILNMREDVTAQRVFAPEEDMERLLREAGECLATLESGTELGRCDIIGFTLQSELHYTNILNMLDLGGVPQRASERIDGDPVVIGGGPQAFNPEPLAEFFDALVLGDGEEVIGEIVDVYRRWQKEGRARQDLLLGLAGIEGVYVPLLYKVTQGEDGMIKKIAPAVPGVPRKVTRRMIDDLDRCPFPESPPVSFMETIHDRLSIEVARGCVRGCRFCHAGMVYRPYRERSPAVLEKIIMNSLSNTGYEEVSLSALSAGDYCHLVPLMSKLTKLLKSSYVSLSLPSIRPGSLPDEVIKEVGEVRKSGFTIAPEAGSERLRRVINKGISEEDILRTAEYIFQNGWKSLKLYFMIGLPTETEEDVTAIYELAQKIRSIGKRSGNGKIQVTVSVSSFVPKAHTPFQWVPMAGLEYLAGVIGGLSRRCRKGKINFKWHSPEMSFIEGILARGDRRLSKVIQRVWEKGGRQEAWTDRFDLSRWIESMTEEGIDPYSYNGRRRMEDEIFPWDHLDTMVSRSFLFSEYRRSLKEEETRPCRIGNCSACGACPPGMQPPGHEPWAPAGAATTEESEDRRFRARLQYDKFGDMKYLSHLELFRAFYRAGRRAGIPLSYTSGFNPHPRISFGPPLPVGAEGKGEMVDMEMRSPYPVARLVEGLNGTLPPGLRIRAARYLPRSAPALFDNIEAARFRIHLPEGIRTGAEEIRNRLSSALSRESIPVERERRGRTKVKDVRPFILEAELVEDDGAGFFDLMLGFTNEGSIRPAEFLQVIFPEGYPSVGEVKMERLGLYRKSMGRYEDAFNPPQPRFQ